MASTRTTTQLHCTEISDVFIWEKIVHFLRVRQVPPNEDEESRDMQDVLQTVLSLRLVCRQLTEHFRPTNQTFWRGMALLCFDFTVPESDMHLRIVEDNPNEPTLQEAIRLWPALDVRFRPSQYQFLTDIQAGERSEASWPESEDAFSLFVDLLLVTESFRQFKGELMSPSYGYYPVDPILLSAIPADADCDPEELDPEHPWPWEGMDDNVILYHPLFAHCGFFVKCWYRAPDTFNYDWLGFRSQDATRDVGEAVYSDPDDSDDELPDELKWSSEFPGGETPKLLSLLELVKARCSDWHRVKVAYLEEGAPIFYVGKSSLSARWVGFVGFCQPD